MINASVSVVTQKNMDYWIMTRIDYAIEYEDYIIKSCANDSTLHIRIFLFKCLANMKELQIHETR